MIHIDGHDILTTLEEKVAPGNAAILVIDMQKDFTQPGGHCHRLGIDLTPMVDLGNKIAKFLDAAREKGVMIVHINAVYDKKHMSAPMHERIYRQGLQPYCQSGTEGIEPHPGLEPKGDEPVIIKNRYDGFYDTDLDIILKSAGIKSVIATGIATQACVDSTCRHAFFNGYYVVFPTDLTGGAKPEHLDSIEFTIEQSFGICTSEEEIVSAWSNS